MKLFVAATCAALLAVVIVGQAGATSSWASRADHVCTVWTTKAKAELGTKPKTPAQLYAWAVKATAIEQQELVALERLGSPTPAGKVALASVKTDIAEIEVGLRDWRAGNKTGFARVFVRWQLDHRPHAAFVKAGAKACG